MYEFDPKNLLLPESLDSFDGSDALLLEDVEVTLIGAGRSGSMIALVLAMLGVRLRLYDPDRLGPENQGLQLYRKSDVQAGRRKVEALADLLQQVTPHLHVQTHAESFEAADTQPRTPLLVVAVDTMATRRRLWEKLRAAPGVLLWLDVRLGPAMMRLHEVAADLPEDAAAYEASLCDDEASAAGDCVDEAATHAAACAAALVGGAVRAFVDGLPRPQWIAVNLDRATWLSGPVRSTLTP